MSDIYSGNAAGPANYNDIITATLNKTMKEVKDNIFNKHVLLYKMNSKGKVKIVDGGTYIEEPLEYTTNTNVGFVSQWQTINKNPNQTLTKAMFDGKIICGTVTVSFQEASQNNGMEKVIDLWAHRAKNTMKTMENSMSTSLFAANPSSLDPWSLAEIVDTSDPASARGNFGLIDRDTYSFWQANEATSSSFSASGISTMSTLSRTCSAGQGTDEPDVICMSSTDFGYMENSMENKIRYTETSSADAKFDNLKFGNAVVVWDKDCPAGTCYLLNTDTIYLAIYSTANFNKTPVRDDNDKLAKSCYIYTIYNLISGNPRRNGKLTISAA